MNPRKERYSRVSRRIWNDSKFRDGLTPIPPCGQGLMFRLLTAPECTVLPGLIPIREAGLAEALGWSLKQFRDAFAECSRNGMAKADWKAGLVWLPNAINHNRPSNPNMVTGWASEWSELPECQLKDEALCSLKLFIGGLGKGFAEALVKTWPNPSGNPSLNQKQEQEQEPPNPPAGGDEAEPVLVVFDAWREETGHKQAQLDRKRRARIQARLKEGFKADQLIQAMHNRRLRPWLMGENPDRKVYDKLSTLLRDAEQVEELLALGAERQPTTAEPVDDSALFDADDADRLYGTTETTA